MSQFNKFIFNTILKNQEVNNLNIIKNEVNKNVELIHRPVEIICNR